MQQERKELFQARLGKAVLPQHSITILNCSYTVQKEVQSGVRSTKRRVSVICLPFLNFTDLLFHNVRENVFETLSWKKMEMKGIITLHRALAL